MAAEQLDKELDQLTWWSLNFPLFQHGVGKQGPNVPLLVMVICVMMVVASEVVTGTPVASGVPAIIVDGVPTTASGTRAGS